MLNSVFGACHRTGVDIGMDMPQIKLRDLNLETAERRLCAGALELAGSIVVAAALLGIARHALKRRLIKLHIEWPRQPTARTGGTECREGFDGTKPPDFDP